MVSAPSVHMQQDYIMVCVSSTGHKSMAQQAAAIVRKATTSTSTSTAKVFSKCQSRNNQGCSARKRSAAAANKSVLISAALL